MLKKYRTRSKEIVQRRICLSIFFEETKFQIFEENKTRTGNQKYHDHNISIKKPGILSERIKVDYHTMKEEEETASLF